MFNKFKTTMKRKTIIFAAFMAAFLASVPLSTMAQGISAQGGSWGLFGSKDADENISGNSGSWGYFNNSDLGDSGQGNGSWGAFNNVDANEEPLTDGILLLAVAGMGYAALKRRKKANASHDASLETI